MKHKTSELTGALLDAGVAKAEGLEWCIERFSIRNPDPVRHMNCWIKSSDGRPVFGAGPYAPSRQWDVGGPIIGRERIDLQHVPATPGRADLPSFWAASIMTDKTRPDLSEGGALSVLAEGYGETALIAAMRAYVASKLGEEVEL